MAIKFYSIILSKIDPFCDGNGRTCKILFANDDKINKLIDGTKIKKLTMQNESLLLNVYCLQKVTILQ